MAEGTFSYEERRKADSGTTRRLGERGCSACRGRKIFGTAPEEYSGEASVDYTRLYWKGHWRVNKALPGFGEASAYSSGFGGSRRNTRAVGGAAYLVDSRSICAGEPLSRTNSPHHEGRSMQVRGTSDDQ